jgi:hypothetical protein
MDTETMQTVYEAASGPDRLLKKNRQSLSMVANQIGNKCYMNTGEQV